MSVMGNQVLVTDKVELCLKSGRATHALLHWLPIRLQAMPWGASPFLMSGISKADLMIQGHSVMRRLI